MTRYTVKVEGMACGMCEAHIADTIRKVCPGAKKVSASHRKGICEFVSEEAVDEAVLKDAIGQTGYGYNGLEKENYEKKRLFGRK